MVSIRKMINRCFDSCVNGSMVIQECSCDKDLGRFDGYDNLHVV